MVATRSFIDRAAFGQQLSCGLARLVGNIPDFKTASTIHDLLKSSRLSIVEDLMDTEFSLVSRPSPQVAHKPQPSFVAETHTIACSLIGEKRDSTLIDRYPISDHATVAPKPIL